jgi:hypothetical protein
MSLNCTARIAYDDLRGWLSEAKRLGEVRRGARRQLAGGHRARC